MIITNSFHGLIFAIINKKLFICFPRDEKGSSAQNSRMMSLLTDLELQNRYFDRLKKDGKYDISDTI